MSLTISTIVCAYSFERWHDLCELVSSLKRQTLKPDEVIIVIDHNEALLAKAGQTFTNYKVIENSSQKGLSGARNSGVAAAIGEIVVFIDDDALAKEDWLERIMEPFSKKEVVASGGAAIPLWETSKPRWFPEEFYWVVGCSYQGMPENLEEVRNVFGGNMAFRKTLLEQVGGFNTNLGRIDKIPVGGEETELCMRVKALKPDGLIMYEPRAVIDHRVSQSRINLSYFLRRCYAEGLSKAVISQLRQKEKSLTTEWTYVLQTLPKSALRHGLAFLKGDLFGFIRVLMLSFGLLGTTFGYLKGKLSLLMKSNYLPIVTELL